MITVDVIPGYESSRDRAKHRYVHAGADPAGLVHSPGQQVGGGEPDVGRPEPLLAEDRQPGHRNDGQKGEEPILQTVGLEPLGVVGEGVPHPEHGEELHREGRDPRTVEMTSEVVREPRDHHDEHEVEEQLQRTHRALPVELLVGPQLGPLPGPEGGANQLALSSGG